MSFLFLWGRPVAYLAIALGLGLSLIWGWHTPPVLADSFNCFQAGNCSPPALSNSSTCLENRDYTVTVLDRVSPVTILSFHGGKIELNTSIISAKLQQLNDWNRYDLNAQATACCLEGKNHYQRLHITSTRFDDPRAVNLVKQYPKSVAIHGYDRAYPQGTICVGGANAPQIQTFIKQVNQQKSLFSNYDLRPINAPQLTNSGDDCYDLKGTSSTNLVNRNGSGKGLQLELSKQMRSDLVNPSASYDVLRQIIFEAISQAMRA